MNLEADIFKRSKLDLEKLSKYGFSKKEDIYVYTKLIMDNTFKIEISVLNNCKIVGKIYDLSFNAEYTAHRLETGRGKFASNIRNSFENILNDIKNKCTTPNYFMTPQANRIAKLIKEKFDNLPEFLWEKTSDSGIFRNSSSQKWYGIIMTVNINKITSGDYEVEILNIKAQPEKVVAALQKRGIYKAYHMNKKYWLTIILDDTLTDKEIMTYIEESHNLTSK